MKSKKAIGYKEVASVLLIALMLVIHAVKLVHLHTPAKTIEPVTQTVNLATDNSCLICDYHFSKEAEITFLSIQIATQPGIIIHPLLYTSQIIPSIGLHYSDRGPPAVD